MDLVSAYRNYIDYEDKDSEEFLFYELYKHTQNWLREGSPDQNFLLEFIELALEFEDEPFGFKNLLDFGLSELIEALNYYNGIEKNIESIEKHLSQASFAFLAWIDEQQYRKIKNIHFSEIDFFIYDIIGGEFPHDSAQNYLKNTMDIDVWIVLKYLEELENSEQIVEIIQSLLKNLNSLPDKYILIAYYVLRYPDQVRDFFYAPEKNISFISLPPEIHYDEIFSIFSVSYEFLFFGNLKVNFYENLKSKHENIVLLALLTMFEITNSELTPGWIEVLERSIGNFWSYKIKNFNYYKKYQPLPEFAIHIINYLSEEEREQIYQTSKIFMIFFENIHRYSKQTFEELSNILSLNNITFEEELRFHLHLANKSKKIYKRMEECASKIYKRIIKNGNTLELLDIEES